MTKEKEDLQSEYYEANIEYNGLVAKKYKLVSKSKHIAAQRAADASGNNQAEIDNL